ncbi:MAG: membrane protein insertase YidC [Chitinivibrionia bacterium]|nr:membrane protein insertase YidC [Chitinivibrionia bacterium]
MDNLDRRAFIAFALSMLLFIGFYWLYSPTLEKGRVERQELAKSQQAADSLAAVSGQGSPHDSTALLRPADADTAPQLLPRIDRASAGTIEVINSFYKIRLSTAGGEITSIQLLKFPTRGLPVELLPEPNDSLSAGFSSIVLAGTDKKVPLSKAGFEAYAQGSSQPLPTGTRITLGEGNRKFELEFRATGENGGTISRYYAFSESSYTVKAGMRLQPASFPFVRSLVWGFGRGLRSTEENTLDDYMSFQAATQLGEELHALKPKDFSKKSSEHFEGTVRWVSLQTKYFIAAMIPSESSGGKVEFLGRKQDHFLNASLDMPVKERRGEIEQEVSIYVGPLDLKGLKSFGVGLEKNVNMGYKWIRPVSWLILWSLIAFNKVIPNYGIIIIILSIITKVLFYRMTNKSFKSMRDMQQLQPKLQAIKEKYKNDRQKISTETMKLYKEGGVNPLGGCLPLLLQMPVFIALFSVLKYTIELRQAPFVGWINDLSQQDVLFLLPVSLPIIANKVSLLPLLMGAGMLLQTKIGGSITGSAPGASQPKVLTYLMPVIFTFIFYSMPSGLVLYWFVNNVLSIAQQYYINKEVREEKKEAMAQEVDDTNMKHTQSHTKRLKKDR